MAAFADYLDMIARYDARELGSMCSDDGHRVSESDLDGNEKMDAALSTATGWVMSAVQQGYRYTDSQLAGLSAEGLSLLKDITCQVAYWVLMRRKPFLKADDIRRVYKEEADELLEKLQKGIYVLDVDEAKDAGTASADTVSRIEIKNNWQLASDAARGRFFPRRRSYRNQ